MSFLSVSDPSVPGCCRCSLMRTLSGRSLSSPPCSQRPTALSNLFSHQVIKNAAWRQGPIDDTWQRLRERISPLIHLWTPTVHLSVHPHTHTSIPPCIHPPSPSADLGMNVFSLCDCVCLHTCGGHFRHWSRSTWTVALLLLLRASKPILLWCVTPPARRLEAAWKNIYICCYQLVVYLTSFLAVSVHRVQQYINNII